MNATDNHPDGIYVHPQALCESRAVGRGTRVWAFAHVLPGAVIGTDCNICDHVFIENKVIIGQRVTIKCGVQLWDGVELADDVFVGPNATFCNDPAPRSKCYLAEPLPTKVERRASVGANATILPGVVIGQNAIVGAGAVVTRSVPPNAIVTGNPAQIVGYVDTDGPTTDGRIESVAADVASAQGARLIRMPLVNDMRGDLTVGEFGRDLPFVPQRYFMIMNVPTREVRGEHAHRACEQVLLCLRGSCKVMTDDGHERRDYLLDDPTLGLYVPSMTWSSQYRYSEDALLLVFASQYYDPADYIRDYQEYLDAVAAAGKPK